MLSRVADSLYWMSRYIERAEHTARLIAVKLDSMVEQTPEDAAASWARVIESLTGDKTPPQSLDAFAITKRLAFDRDNNTSMVTSLALARVNRRCAGALRVWEDSAASSALPGMVPLGAPARLFRVLGNRGGVAFPRWGAGFLGWAVWGGVGRLGFFRRAGGARWGVNSPRHQTITARPPRSLPRRKDFTLTTILSPTVAYLFLLPPSTLMHKTSFAPELSATVNLLSCCIMIT